MPALLTCLVGKRLCEKIEEDHWELRNYCANLLAYLCKRYGDSYENLQARITKTLLQAFLDPNKALTTHYGAIVGMTALGHHVIQLLLLPNIGAYMKLLEPELNSPNFVKKEEARRCHAALLNAAGRYLNHVSREITLIGGNTMDQTLKQTQERLESNPYYSQLFEIFGESLLPLIHKDRIEPIGSTLL